MSGKLVRTQKQIGSFPLFEEKIEYKDNNIILYQTKYLCIDGFIYKSFENKNQSGYIKEKECDKCCGFGCHYSQEALIKILEQKKESETSQLLDNIHQKYETLSFQIKQKLNLTEDVYLNM